MKQSRILAISNRVYTMLLHAYPAPFRREYGRDMAQVFRDDLRGSLQEGGYSAAFSLWLLTFFDLFKTAVSEHILEVFHMPVEKITRWSGPAAAIGGILFSLGIIWNFGIENGSNFTMSFVIFTFLASTPFLGLGMYGLYKRLSTKSGFANGIFFALSFACMLIYTIGTTLMIVLDIDDLLIPSSVAWVLMQVGLVGMGFIALSTKSLGKWSFTPILIAAVSLLGILMNFLNNYVVNTTMIIVLVFYALSWVLLGIGIMQNQVDEAGPALVT